MLVRQLSGEWRVKDESSKSFLVGQWNFCVSLVARIKHVYRDAKTLADRLPNRAIDQAVQQAG
jgi:hypothetical protein